MSRQTTVYRDAYDSGALVVSLLKRRGMCNRVSFLAFFAGFRYKRKNFDGTNTAVQ